VARKAKNMYIKKIILKLSQIGRKNRIVRLFLRRTHDILINCASLLPDKIFAYLTYRFYTGLKLNLESPETFNEKLWWLKLNYRNPLQKICSDKYLVRGYVEQCGLKDTLIPLIGVYENANSIPIYSFKEEVFIKCTHGSGTNIIYNPDKIFDKSIFISEFNQQLKKDYSKYSREWNYKDANAKIICEKVVRDSKGNLPKDYKFFCFNGEPKLLLLSNYVCSEDGQHDVSGKRFLNVFDMNLNFLPIQVGIAKNSYEPISSLGNFTEMIECARKLSEPFPFSRIDLYNVDGKIYFGEITFYPSGGYGIISPQEWELRLGEWLNIDDINTEHLIA
jgi:hypothetical protein